MQWTPASEGRVEPCEAHRLAAEVRDLPTGTGVNALLAARADRVRMLDVDDPGTTADLDTPEDYRAWVEARRDGHEGPNR